MARIRSRLFWSIIVIATILSPLIGASTPAVAATQTGLSATLTSSLPSSQPVGTTIQWTASSTGAAAPVYRFQAIAPNGQVTASRDYYSQNSWSWTPLVEGTYTITVSVGDGYGSTTTARAQSTFTVTPRVTGSTPIVTPTANPLVALYSAPVCRRGLTMVVRFRPTVGGPWQLTNSEPCDGTHTMNFVIAGIEAQTPYVLQDVTSSGSSTVDGPQLDWTSGAIGVKLPRFTVTTPGNHQTDHAQSVVFYSIPLSIPVATDLKGRPIWYDRIIPSSVYSTRIDPGGHVLLIGTGAGPTGLATQVFLEEADLAGHVVRETNLYQINAELAALGQQPIIGFDHELRTLPNGQTVAIGYTERLFQNVQGSTGTVDILGEDVIALNQNWQVSWVWNAFDHLNVNRPAVLGEVCANTNVEEFGCPHLQLASQANDWLHANSVAYSSADHNLIVSLRNQDWVIKIDYQDGTGNGNVIWTLGNQGNFTVQSSDPSPWFSGQHDASYISPTQIALFDDGNTRCASAPAPCDSRGQVWTLDESTMTATLTTNDDLGTYSPALGSAEQLSNGNDTFTSGLIAGALSSQAVEFLPSGTINNVISVDASVYRSYRLASLYSGK